MSENNDYFNFEPQTLSEICKELGIERNHVSTGDRFTITDFRRTGEHPVHPNSKSLNIFRESQTGGLIFFACVKCDDVLEAYMNEEGEITVTNAMGTTVTLNEEDIIA